MEKPNEKLIEDLDEPITDTKLQIGDVGTGMYGTGATTISAEGSTSTMTGTIVNSKSKPKKEKKKREWSIKKFKIEPKEGGVRVEARIKEYFTPYAFVWLMFIIMRMLLGATVSIAYIIAGFITFLIVDPNIGKILMPEYHRWWLTHSIVLPLSIYWGLHPYLIMGEITKEFGILLFLPVVVHLLRDFWEDMNDPKWTVKLYPIPIDLGKTGTIIWVILNCIGMTSYMTVLMVL